MRKATEKMAASCPFRMSNFLPLAASHTIGRPVPTAGDNPLAIWGKRHRPDRIAVPSEGQQFLAAGRSHTLAVWSALPVTIRWPSGE